METNTYITAESYSNVFIPSSVDNNYLNVFTRFALSDQDPR